MAAAAPSARHTLYGLAPASDRRGLIAALAGAGEIMSSDKVRQLRRALYEDEALERAEAEALFALERAQKGRGSRDWTRFFVEILTDHLVWRGNPENILDQDRALWLMEQAELMQQVDLALSPAVYALLAHVLAEAAGAPAWFVEAVRARRAAVLCSAAACA